MPRTALHLLLALLIAAVGCRRKDKATPAEGPAEPTRPEPARTSPVPSRPGPDLETLRGWGAVFSSDRAALDGQITWAALIGTKFGDREVAALRSLRRLKSLDLSYAKITDAALDAVGDFPDLNTLDLTKTAITDAGLAKLKPLHFLTVLNIEQTAVSDAGVNHLLALRNLRTLTVRQTRITAAGLRRLREGISGIDVVQDAEWHEYAAPDRRFTAAFPWRAPQAARKRTMTTPFGAVADTIVETVDGPRSAAVSFADFDTPQLAAANLDKVVDAGRDAIAAQWRGRVTADVRTDLGGGAFTRDVTITIPDRPGQGPAYFRWVGAGRRLYTLAILADRGSVPVAERDRFFSAFQMAK